MTKYRFPPKIDINKITLSTKYQQIKNNGDDKILLSTKYRQKKNIGKNPWLTPNISIGHMTQFE